MKKLLLILALCAAPAFTGCATIASTQATEYKTLATVGITAKAGMDYATALLKQGKITVEQWQKVATNYDTKFQPSYQLAVAAARADLSTIASPDVTVLANQLAALVAQLTAK